MPKLTKLIKKSLPCVLSLLILFSSVSSLIVNVSAESDSLNTLIAKTIYYKREEHQTDLLKTLDAMSTQYPNDCSNWKSITDFWTDLDNNMAINTTAPDNLPTANHAFVVLGFALNNDGTMREELVGRLETAKAAAEAYPDSYILVTGGVEKNGYTEGDRMAAWLIENGISADRILVENHSANTRENALFSMDILYERGDIKYITPITSSYHLRRSQVNFHAAALIKADENEVAPIQLVSNVGYVIDGNDSTIQIAANLAALAGVTDEYNALLSGNVPVSELESISVSGPSKKTYTTGDNLNTAGLIVTAHYTDDEFTRNVTSLCTVTGYNPNTAGIQTITVTYTENDIIKTAYFDVTVKEKDIVLNELIAKLLYFQQLGYETDLLKTFNGLHNLYPNEYQMWRLIIDYWKELNESPEINTTAPDNLPTSNHAFVVLGYALNDDGTMQDELIGRLETAKAAAEAYPNSYIMVTGGVAKGGYTEAERMAEWLIDNGVSAERIIMENYSSSTADNALFSLGILYNQGDIDSISIISSTYHLRRGQILFYEASQLVADEYDIDTPIQIVGNVGYEIVNTSYPIETEQMLIAYSVALVAGVQNEYFALASSEPVRAELESITLSGPNKVDYAVGDSLDTAGLVVTAHYVDDDFTRNVTSLSTITGYDPNTVGTQTVTVTYEENKIIKTAAFNISVTKTSSDESKPDGASSGKPADATKTGDITVFAFAAITILGLAVTVITRKRIIKK